MRKIYTSLFLIVFMIMIGSISSIFLLDHDIPETVFRVDKGETAKTIANNLFEQNIINCKYGFILFAKYNSLDSSLKSGDYIFSGQLNIIDVVKKIQEGRVKTKKLKIIEGFRIEEVIQQLSDKGFGDYKTFNKLVYDTLFIKEITRFDIQSLEGFIYPDTYFLSEGLSEKFIIEYLVKAHFKKTDNLDFSKSNLTYYEVLKLASIVEKEVINRGESSLVASVYLNRLKKNMMLQADPTVSYILEKNNKRKEIILYKDLKIKSPYNTYLHIGLPPTPICSPSIVAIEAVLNPQKTDFFYFFADGKGNHIFSETYTQHLNRQKYY
ncbi:MAG: endolytic transglycosylase MltG [Candidatus Cloacimonadota bacterium]|nr:endolytic transglycosylase MltG [Candidatus Cloacimonadota bacterium]